MNPQSFNKILSSKIDLDATRTRELNAIVKEFPYFQAARALQLKGLYQNHSFSYNVNLKKTAAYTTNRGVLFEYITSEDFKQHDISSQIRKRQKEERYEEVVETELMNPEEAQRVLDPNLFEEHEGEKEEINAEKEEEKALVSFDKNEERSFSEWLKLTRTQPIEKSIKKKNYSPKIMREQKIIDRFIANEPKIVPGKPSKGPISIKDYEPDSPLMTETLAKIYAKQKKYSKAIQAYKILILKNPEKSGLFADRIRELEILIENKSK